MTSDSGGAYGGAGAVGNECSEHSRWYVLRTRSHQEKLVAAFLSGSGVENYLPLTRRVGYRGRNKAIVREPLFPGYLFLRGEAEQAFLADRNPRVAQLIHVADQARLEWELRNIRLAESRGAEFAPRSYLAEGSRVEVRCGPFKGVQGYVDRVTNANEIVLQVETFWRGATLRIERDLLEPIEPASRRCS